MEIPGDALDARAICGKTSQNRQTFPFAIGAFFETAWLDENADGNRLTISFEKTGIKTVIKDFVSFA
jgi:hypothetical protein